MEIMEIIKDAIVFPSNDLLKLAIYLVLMIISGLLAVFGLAFFFVGLAESAAYLIIGLILFIVGLVVGFIFSGYQVSIIKSGIGRDPDVPQFEWKGNMITGVKYLVVTFVYFIIPTIIVLITGWATNLFGLAYDVFYKMMIVSMTSPTATAVVSDVVPQSELIALGNAMIITGIVAFIVFLLFALLHTMGESRLAKTDSLGYALNMVEAFNDIGKIGWVKVIAVVFLIFIIVSFINWLLSFLNGYIPGISVLSLFITPYLAFFASRATGLLYSDIA